jgi:hypothetical protein
MLNVMVQQLEQIVDLCQISFKANGEGNYEKCSMSIKNSNRLYEIETFTSLVKKSAPMVALYWWSML